MASLVLAPVERFTEDVSVCSLEPEDVLRGLQIGLIFHREQELSDNVGTVPDLLLIEQQLRGRELWQDGDTLSSLQLLAQHALSQTDGSLHDTGVGTELTPSSERYDAAA